MKLILAFILALTIHAAAVQTVTLPQAIAATAAQEDKDLSSLKGTVGFVLTAKSTAGTSPTATVKLQSSAPLAKSLAVETGTTSGVALRTASNTAIKLAASFTTAAGTTPSIKRVVLPLKKHATLTAGTLTVTIASDSSGPNATLATAATFDLSALTASFTGATFDFATPLQLAANTKYWVVLEGDYTVDATANVTWRTTTVASGGNASVYGSSWSASATNNLNIIPYVYNFSDVTGGAFTQVTATGSVQYLTVPIQNFGSVFRTHTTIGGTNSPSFIVGVAALQTKP